MDSGVLFYVNGLGFYFLAAIVLSFIAQYLPETKVDLTADPNADEDKDAVPSDNSFPENKLPYCYFCKKFLLSDEQVKTHAQGKKHKNLAQDTKKWYRYVPREEYEKQREKAKKK
jgi:hypothetical protein